MRDIDIAKNGLHLILPKHFDTKKLLKDQKYLIQICDSQVFNFPSSYAIQVDVQEEILRKGIINDDAFGPGA